MTSKRELIIITGPRGVGKSTLAYTYVPPSRIGGVVLHDTEGSANRVIEELDRLGLSFGEYIPIGDEFADLPGDDDLLDLLSSGKEPWTGPGANALVGYYKWLVGELAEKIIEGQHHTLIIDTLEKLEAGMASYVEQNERHFGFHTKKDKAFGKIWSGGIYFLYQKLFDAVWNRGIDTIIMCSHLKSVWEGNRPVLNKVNMSGKKLLYQMSKFMLWLVNDLGNADGAPAGIVLKERLGSIKVEDDGWNLRRMLPHRIPHCTWKDIRRYMEIGCDLSMPAAGESLSSGERDMISPLLSDKQMRLMLLEAEKDLEQERSAQAFQQKRVSETPRSSGLLKALPAPGADPEIVAKFRELLLDHTAQEVTEMLSSEYSMPLVLAARMEVQNATAT